MWEWSSAERRLLLITVIGTVAANLITVLVVALAFLARRYVPDIQGMAFGPLAGLPQPLRWLFGSLGRLWITIPVWILGLSLTIFAQRKFNKHSRLAVIIPSCVLVLYILAVIGYANATK